MRRRADAATVGAFVLGALVLAVVAVVVWGSGRLFRDTATAVCYFEGSVEGLEVGAAAKVRGVAIGRVERILLRYRQRSSDDRVPVFLEIDLKRLVGLGGQRPDDPKVLADLIARGLRARLEPQSLVTGKLFVNFGLFPDAPIKLSQLDAAGGYPEIPTVPTQLAELGKSVSAIVSRLEGTDLAGMVKSVDRAAASFERLTSSEQIPELLARLSATLASYQKLGRNLDGGLGPLVGELQAAITDARRVLVGLDGATGDARRLVAPEAPVSVRASEALNEVGRAAAAVRDLAEYLQRNPNSLLVGKSR